MPKIFSVSSPEPDIVAPDDDSNDPKLPYGFGAQQPIVPPCLNDLNLPPNPLNVLAAMTVVQQNPTQHEDNYSPQSPEPSEPSPIPTPPVNPSTNDGWESPHTTTHNNTFYSEDETRRVHLTSPLDETFHSDGEPRRIYQLHSPKPPSPPRNMTRKLEFGKSFPKRRGVSQQVCKACGKILPPIKDIPGPSTKD